MSLTVNTATTFAVVCMLVILVREHSDPSSPPFDCLNITLNERQLLALCMEG